MATSAFAESASIVGQSSLTPNGSEDREALLNQFKARCFEFVLRDLKDRFPFETILGHIQKISDRAGYLVNHEPHEVAEHLRLLDVLNGDRQKRAVILIRHTSKCDRGLEATVVGLDRLGVGEHVLSSISQFDVEGVDAHLYSYGPTDEFFFTLSVARGGDIDVRQFTAKLTAHLSRRLRDHLDVRHACAAGPPATPNGANEVDLIECFEREPAAPEQTIREIQERIQGRTVTALREAERLLAGLKGESVTQRSVAMLKDFLREREWGLSCCKCEKPAAPVWKVDPGCAAGGRMVLLHSDEAGTRTHCSQTRFAELKLVNRPDRRRGKNRSNITSAAVE